ncbi:zinc finger protein [Macleaya cordata]|uniref:Zinc finger protein n=1 Tax=Macleaya cordata TaxID=56857 RepID=A0A200QGM8_MACCD|nr:zinc finger protein [Macleaya cordata]
MASPVPSGVRRPGPPPPNYNPNFQQTPDALSSNMQNLQINRPPGPPSTVPGSSVPRHPPPFAPTSHMSFPPSGPPSGSTLVAPPAFPPSSFPGASPVTRPGPPPSGFPTMAPAVAGPPQATVSQNMASGRPSGPPFSQPPPFGARPSPGVFTSSPAMTGPPAPSSSAQSPFSNGPPRIAPLPGAPPSPFTNALHPPAGPPAAVPPRGPFGQNLRPFPGSPPTGAPMDNTSRPPPPFSAPTPGMPPPFSAASQGMQPPFAAASQGMPPPFSGTSQGGPPPFSAARQGGPPFSAASQGGPPPFSSPYGPQMGPMQLMPGATPIPGGMPPLRPYGTQLVPPNQSMQVPPGMGLGHLPVSGAAAAGSSKIDPNQIPRPIPTSSVTLYETRQNGQANLPPPATSDFIVKDTGNCSPRYMRCTINQIPCTGDLLSTSSMHLALMVQPLALPHPSEEPIQVVDFGESGPVRCSRCKGYINPFMKFIDQGRRFICNLCGFTDETPRDYHCNLGPDGRRRDADERPELCRGTVEFVATKEYMVRDPMPAVFFFLVDVSMNAIQTGATAAACSAINQSIADLPEGPRTMVGIATFDSTIHFYNLKRVLQQPLMLIVPDVQDVYTPLQTDVIVPLAECRQHLEQLLENIPNMFQSNRVAESAFGAATKAAFLAMKSTGGKLLVFQSGKLDQVFRFFLPSVGFGALSAREADGRTNSSAGEKETHKLLQPADKTLKTMAIEFAEYQVCVDIFVTTQTYVDIASISVVPRTTGGQVYYYHPFSAVSDSAKLYNDLRWNVTRPQGFEAVMRVRCSQGIQVQEYSGSFCKRIPTDVDLPAIDCDKTIMVTFKHDDKFLEGSECAFQCALLYTTVYGQRRIRVTTLSLTCTSVLSNLFRSADLDTQFACFLKQAANEIPTAPLIQIREQMTNLCVSILHSYRKFCATVSSPGQLILPEALKLLPLYILALIKSIGLRNDGRLDDRSYWVSRVTSLPTPLAVPLVYPRMMTIHNLLSKEGDGSLVTVPLSSEHVTDDGIYLLENGEDGLIYVGKMVDPDILRQLFDVTSIDEIPTQEDGVFACRKGYLSFGHESCPCGIWLVFYGVTVRPFIIFL